MAGAFKKGGKEYSPGQLVEWDGVSYRLAGKTRDKPVAPDYLEKLMQAVHATDPSLRVRIHSGGQITSRDPALKDMPGGWTGSTRHNVDPDGWARTADVVLVRNGEIVTPAQDKQLYVRFMQNAAAAGFPGLGHYSWGVHIGGGSEAAWGPNRRSSSLDPDFDKAITAGRKSYASGVRLPYADIPQTAPLPLTMPQGLRQRADPTLSGARPAELSAFRSGSGTDPFTALVNEMATSRGIAVPTLKGSPRPTQAQTQAMRAVPSQMKLDETSALVDRLRMAEPDGTPPRLPSTFPGRPGVIPPNTSRGVPALPGAIGAMGSARSAAGAALDLPGAARMGAPVPFERIGNPDDQQIARSAGLRTASLTPQPLPHSSRPLPPIPKSIPKTPAEEMWERTNFRDPHDLPGVGSPRFEDIASTMAPRPRGPVPPVPATMSIGMAGQRSGAAQQQPPMPATMSAGLRGAPPAVPPVPASFLEAQAARSRQPAYGDFSGLQPLTQEDGDNGYWDAKTMGNGQGQSYVVRNGVVTYVSDEQMRQIAAAGGRPQAMARPGLPRPPAQIPLSSVANIPQRFEHTPAGYALGNWWDQTVPGRAVNFATGRPQAPFTGLLSFLNPGERPEAPGAQRRRQAGVVLRPGDRRYDADSNTWVPRYASRDRSRSSSSRRDYTAPESLSSGNSD